MLWKPQVCLGRLEIDGKARTKQLHSVQVVAAKVAT